MRYAKQTIIGLIFVAVSIVLTSMIPGIGQPKILGTTFTQGPQCGGTPINFVMPPPQNHGFPFVYTNHFFQTSCSYWYKTSWPLFLLDAAIWLIFIVFLAKVLLKLKTNLKSIKRY